MNLEKLAELLKSQIKSGLPRPTLYGVVVNYTLINPRTGESKKVKEILTESQINELMDILCPNTIEFEW